ncbi:MAG: isocitrate lyase/PEP mutase family protein [Spirochaetales bacterium]|jgi:2-methylisocitrate lyase-like PEP mutase family enzyme|nr:isocitrate lyase/PEP mutase family protein [Spirochaetales bacterium]
MTTRQVFRKLLDTERYLVLPGAYDCLSASIIQSMGFKALDVTGLGLEVSRLGQPDIGIATMTEVIDHAWSIIRSVNIPVIFDADTGYGGLFNVARTIRAFECIGATGIHIEDQIFPKKCGAMSGKLLISQKEMIAKIKVAREVLTDKEFVIISRCDGKNLGLDEVKRRLYSYLDAGADLAMLGDDYEVEELRELGSEFFGRLYLVAGVFPVVPMCLPALEFADMGFKVISYPLVSVMAAAKAIEAVYEPLRRDNWFSREQHKKFCMPLSKVNTLVKLDEWNALESLLE